MDNQERGCLQTSITLKIQNQNQRENKRNYSKKHFEGKRAKTKIKNLINWGLDVDSAKRIGYSRKGHWRLAKTHEISKAISNARLERNGFLFFLPVYTMKIKQEIENVVNV